MITEDYVSFEVAKLLKEKGFKEITQGYINADKEIYMLPFQQGVYELGKKQYPYPTLQMAMKWLRQQGIYITIMYGDYPALKKIVWTPQIDSLTGFDIPDEFYKDYPTYEEACEAAIKYCLVNLI